MKITEHLQMRQGAGNCFSEYLLKQETCLCFIKLEVVSQTAHEEDPSDDHQETIGQGDE